MKGKEVVENMGAYLDYESKEEAKWGGFEPFVLHHMGLAALLAYISALEAVAEAARKYINYDCWDEHDGIDYTPALCNKCEHASLCQALSRLDGTQTPSSGADDTQGEGEK